MCKPFIRNHQYNLIKKQANYLLHTYNTVFDPKVVEAVRHSVLAKITEAFLYAEEPQKQALEKIAAIYSQEELQQYLQSLEPCLTEFAQVTEQQLKKLFPKIKKLKIPDLSSIDYRHITYLSWNDIATNKMFLVYDLNGRIVGIEGRCTPTHKKSVCFLCNRHDEVALFSAISKSRPANATPDYYKAIGNYLCVNSEACNKGITDVAALERFVREVVGYHEP